MSVVTEEQPQPERSYEEKVALARANLERHLDEQRREIERYVAEGGDPAADLDAFVRETFDRDTLLAVWREWRAERGKPDLDEL